MSAENMSLRDVIIIILKRWRTVIVISLVGALLLGGYKLFSGIRNYTPVLNSEQQDTYESALSEYQQQKDDIEKGIESLTEQLGAIPGTISGLDERIKTQSDYIDNSPLMKINPQEKSVERINLVVTAGDQNTNSLKNIMVAYCLAAHNDDIYEEIQKHVNLNFGPGYLDELIHVEVYDENTDAYTSVAETPDGVKVYNDGTENNKGGIITIECYYDDADTAKIIAETVCAQMLKQKDEITSYLGAHTISLYNETHFTMVDKELEKLQYTAHENLQSLRKQRSDSLTSMVAIEDSISKLNDSLNALAMPVNLITSPGSILKSGIKYAVAGFAGGLILSVFIVLFLSAIDNKVTDEFKSVHRYSLRLIGSLPVKRKRRLYSFDRCVQRFEGKMQVSDDRGECLRASCSRLMDIIGPDVHYVVACTGSCDSHEIEAAVKDLASELRENGFNHVELIPGGSVLSSAGTVEALTRCQAVLLCEKLCASTYTAMEQEMAYLKTVDKPVIGILFV